MTQNKRREYIYYRYAPSTYFKSKMLSIYQLIFNSRMDTTRIRNFIPIGSPVMREITLIKKTEIESSPWIRKACLKWIVRGALRLYSYPTWIQLSLIQ